MCDTNSLANKLKSRAMVGTKGKKKVKKSDGQKIATFSLPKRITIGSDRNVRYVTQTDQIPVLYIRSCTYYICVRDGLLFFSIIK